MFKAYFPFKDGHLLEDDRILRDEHILQDDYFFLNDHHRKDYRSIAAIINLRIINCLRIFI